MDNKKYHEEYNQTPKQTKAEINKKIKKNLLNSKFRKHNYGNIDYFLNTVVNVENNQTIASYISWFGNRSGLTYQLKLFKRKITPYGKQLQNICDKKNISYNNLKLKRKRIFSFKKDRKLPLIILNVVGGLFMRAKQANLNQKFINNFEVIQNNTPQFLRLRWFEIIKYKVGSNVSFKDYVDIFIYALSDTIIIRYKKEIYYITLGKKLTQEVFNADFKNIVNSDYFNFSFLVGFKLF